ncbi:11787_t:CDS:1, partial [Gigaspora margarita]
HQHWNAQHSEETNYTSGSASQLAVQISNTYLSATMMLCLIFYKILQNIFLEMSRYQCYKKTRVLHKVFFEVTGINNITNYKEIKMPAIKRNRNFLIK